ncbi:MAG: type II toxin-antitoxin system VapB family antitoxin [Bryobacteraceae bacterium]
MVRDIRLLAELTGQPITDAVAEAVRAKLVDAQRAKEADIAERLRRVAVVQARIAALPRIGELPTDADFYDEDGIPR